MNALIWILFFATGLLYSIAFFNALIPFLSKRVFDDRLFYKLVLGAFSLHTLSLGLVTYKAGSIPVSSVFELFMLIAWFVILIDLFFTKILKMRLALFFGAMIAAILTLSPLMCPYFNVNIDTQIRNPLTLSHIIFAGLSYAFMGLGFVLAIMQFLQISSLEKRQSSLFCRILPPLSNTSRYLFSTECFATFFMLLSIVLGVYSYFVYSWDLSAMYLKFVCVFIVFALQLGFVVAINKNLLRAKAVAILGVMLFVVSLLLLFLIDHK